MPVVHCPCHRVQPATIVPCSISTGQAPFQATYRVFWQAMLTGGAVSQLFCCSIPLLTQWLLNAHHITCTVQDANQSEYTWMGALT